MTSRASVQRALAELKLDLRAPGNWDAIRRDAGYTQAAWLAARSLLPVDSMEELVGGDLVVPLSDESWMCVTLLQSGRIGGFATRRNSIYLACVNDGAARALAEIASSIWLDPSFRPDIEPTALLPEPPAHFVTPRGLEHAAQAARLGRDANGARLMTSPMPDWMVMGLPNLSGPRRYALERTVREGLRFMLAHEIFHVLLGHIDFGGKRGLALLGERPHRLANQGMSASSLPPEVLRAFEIEADRAALDELFRRSIEADAREVKVPGRPAQFESLLTTLGAALVMLIFHSQHAFSGQPDGANQHPPLWFRADEVLRAKKLAHERGPIRDGSRTEQEIHRLEVRGFLDQADHDHTIATIGDIHPMLGEWLAPSTHSDRESLSEAILREARLALEDYFGANRPPVKRVLRSAKALS